MEFLPDGTARHSEFIAKFQVKGPRVVELRLDKQKATLTFNKPCTAFSGVDFNGTRRIDGKLLN